MLSRARRIIKAVVFPRYIKWPLGLEETRRLQVSDHLHIMQFIKSNPYIKWVIETEHVCVFDIG